MQKDELEETNITLQYIKDIFHDEKMINCLEQFNKGNPTQKFVYAGAAISYLTNYLTDTNDLLNFLHTVLALDMITKNK